MAMNMHIEITVGVDVSKVSGQLASKDDVAEVIRTAIEEALNDVEISDIGANGDSEYAIDDFQVT